MSRRVRDQGAAQTRLIMRAARAGRRLNDWSQERLADEMTAVGVPWTFDMVVNLELGRRKLLGVHELYALSYVLDVAPIELLAPTGVFPVLPHFFMHSDEVRTWITGRTSRTEVFR